MSTRGAVLAGLSVVCLLTSGAGRADQADIDRGEYLLHASGCSSCHTGEASDARPLAGGRALDTPFGTFYTPNITPDIATGIGGWSDDAFVTALWEGIGPDGDYYPAFPYTSYTGMSRQDVLAIKAYLFSIEPVSQPNREHELAWYLFTRLAAWGWKLLNFTPARYTPDLTQAAAWNRGAYLARHLGHCGECHTPRDRLGRLRTAQELAGNPNGPDDKKVPDITPNRNTGIGRWSTDEIELFLELGMLPDGDFAGGAMSRVIDDNTSQLVPADRHAIALYLQTVPASGT